MLNSRHLKAYGICIIGAKYLSNLIKNQFFESIISKFVEAIIKKAEFRKKEFHVFQINYEK
jgi:hypothetical protein